jgi:hypothetical protein
VAVRKPEPPTHTTECRKISSSAGRKIRAELKPQIPSLARKRFPAIFFPPFFPAILAPFFGAIFLAAKCVFAIARSRIRSQSYDRVKPSAFLKQEYFLLL